MTSRRTPRTQRDQGNAKGARKKPGPKPALSREAIVHHALAIADREGLDHLTLRRLANGLGVAPMAVYRYFRNKADLTSELHEAVIGLQPLTDHQEPNVRAWLRTTFRNIRRALADHPGVLPLLGSRAGAGPHALRILEVVLGTLRRAGVADPEAVRGFYSLLSYTIGFALLESTAHAQRRKLGIDDDAEWLRLSRLHLEALPLPRFTHTVGVAPHLARIFTDAQFEDGLARLLGALRLP
jgi:AcrR family transcriptional regulator